MFIQTVDQLRRVRYDQRLRTLRGAAEHSSQALEIMNSIAANVTDEKLRDNFLTAARSSVV